MEILEERVALLEGTVEEQSSAIGGIREAVLHLDERMDRRFASFEQRMDQRFEAFEQRMDQRFEAFERRMDQRFEAFEQRIDRRFERVDLRMDALDGKMSRQFMWLVGLQVTTLAAMVVALAAR